MTSSDQSSIHLLNWRLQKCDGIQPVCGRCLDKKRQCGYRDQFAREESLEREAAALEERVRENTRNALGFDTSLLPQRWWQADEPPIFFARLL